MHLFLPTLRPADLHIPDGFLSLPVSITLWAVTLALIGLAVRRAGPVGH